MCLIFISIQQHPVYKLVIAANRDEFYKRSTAPAGYWKDHPEILGGRDLEAGGTWLGITKRGKIGLITNFRDPRNINPNAPSRGQLVSKFLENAAEAPDYLKEMEFKAALYNGFNLIAGTVDGLWCLSNHKQGIEKLYPGLTGLSNHLLDTPWPKVTRGKERLAAILQNHVLEVETLFRFLYDDQTAPDAQLPDTGIGLERERALSSMFIKTAGYGTRCSTVVLIDRRNRVSFSERVYNVDTFQHATSTFEFDLTS